MNKLTIINLFFWIVLFLPISNMAQNGDYKLELIKTDSILHGLDYTHPLYNQDDEFIGYKKYLTNKVDSLPISLKSVIPLENFRYNPLHRPKWRVENNRLGSIESASFGHSLFVENVGLTISSGLFSFSNDMPRINEDPIYVIAYYKSGENTTNHLIF